MSSVILRLDSPKSAPSRRRPGSISRSLLRRQVGIKINPVPIICLDQIDFPVSLPLLDLLFATQRRFVVVVNLKPNQPIHPVCRREPRHQLVFVLPYPARQVRSEEHTSELQSHVNLVCRLLLEKKKKK